jgi:predicted ribosomally synthesized peptide with SipW-like signal peptide
MGMKPRFNTRKSAALIATAGLSLMLVGAGLSASFTDSGVVSQSVAVGTFQIELSTADTSAVISADKKSITFTAPAIVSSAPASAPIAFTVKNVGSIPVSLHVEAAVSGPAKFTALGGPIADVVGLVQGATHDYAGGLQWSELVNDDLGRTVSITYTISATG